MKIHIISFTGAGAALAEKLKQGLQAAGTDQVEVTDRHRGMDGQPSLQAWTGERFQTGSALLFIGACGIAVRSIAPFVKSKTTDPAVLVIDESGQFCIPLLSGHIGQANELAVRTAALTGGTAVLTTATDVNHLFAVDSFAARNGLQISDLKLARDFAAGILETKKAVCYLPGDLSAELQVTALPDCLTCISLPEKAAQKNIAQCPDIQDLPQLPCFLISPYQQTDPVMLQLIPQQLILGIGCRRGKSAEELSAFFHTFIRQHHLKQEAFRKIVSIDLKKEEPGICALAQELQLPYETWPEQVLAGVPGTFSASPFVKEVTGVDNVCERAVIAGGAARILVAKTAKDGMTMAVGILKEVFHVS